MEFTHWSQSSSTSNRQGKTVIIIPTIHDFQTEVYISFRSESLDTSILVKGVVHVDTFWYFHGTQQVLTIVTPGASAPCRTFTETLLQGVHTGPSILTGAVNWFSHRATS